MAPTTMAGLATAQSDMLISLAEEVDRQAATIAALTGERDYYRTAADNLTASVQAGWGRAHALGDELRARDQALAEATAAIERLRSSSPTIVINTTFTGPTEKEFAEKLYAELERLLDPAQGGPTPDMLAGRAHEILGTDPREMTQGWRA